jgi:predicted transposase YbfD/YdcC
MPRRPKQDPPPALQEYLEGVPDPRLDRRKRHQLTDILMLAICGALCGVDNFVELERFCRAKLDWFRTFLALPNGIPSHDTFGRVFALLDARRFRTVFLQWANALSQQFQVRHIAVDGKTLRASVDRANGCSALHLVNAWAVDAGLALGTLAVEAGTNELATAPLLLELLHLRGCLVTLDALHCQRATTQQLTQSGADWLIAVKLNQPELHRELAEYFEDPDTLAALTRQRAHYLATRDQEHGRVERRRHWFTTEVDWLPEREAWGQPNVIGRVERQRTVSADQKTTTEVTYYLGRMREPSVQAFAAGIRGHWRIENQLHWCLDVAFDEDRNRARTAHAQEVFAIVRQIALNLLRQDTTTKVGLKTKRKMCGWDHDYLLRILSGDPTRADAS